MLNNRYLCIHYYVIIYNKEGKDLNRQKLKPTESYACGEEAHQ